MGRHKTNASRNFFKYDDRENKSLCGICQTVIKGNHASNLERHLKRCHNWEFEKLKKEKEKNLRLTEERGLNSSDAENHPCFENLKRIYCDKELESGQQNKKTKLNGKYGNSWNCQNFENLSLENFKKMTTPEFLIVKLNSERLLKGFVELVTLNGCSFETLDFSGFKRIMNPIFNALGQNFQINSESIKSLLPEMAFKVFSKIKLTLDKRLISLKIDSVTLKEKSILGIHAIVAVNGKIDILTLGMVESNNKPTENEVKEITENILEKYDIDLKQIYSITVDNGNNVIKFDNFLNSAIEEDNSSEVNIKKETEEHFEKERVYISLGNLKGIECAVCAMESAINESLNSPDFKSLISEARSLVNSINVSSLTTMSDKINVPPPIIDRPNNWETTYNMLQMLLKCKDFIFLLTENSGNYCFLEEKWEKLSLMVHTLRPLHEASVKLRSQQITFGDFYGIWIECKIKVRNLKNSFAFTLCKKFSDTEKSLMERESLLGAVYLDPRYQLLLTVSQKAQAVLHLKNIWECLKAFEKSSMTTSKEEMEPTTVTSDETFDDLEEFLRSKESANKSLVSTEINIEYILNSFEYVQRLDKKKDILEFWEENKNRHPQLYKIATVVLAIPVAQTSLDRVFSSLKFILKDNKNCLNKKTLEEILIIRNNFNLI